MKKFLAYIFIFGFVLVASAQDINNYKYVIIPETFEFTGDIDQYRLNSLTKFLFEKNGYNTLMRTENKPEDLQQQRCLGLQTRLEDNSGLFVTKLKLKLVDCNDQVVFETKEGRSREKDFQVAYQEALRDAFTSLEKIDYRYVQSSDKNDKSEKGIVVIPSVKEQFSEKAEEVEKEVEVEKTVEVEASTEITNNMVQSSKAAVSRLAERTYQYSGKNYSLKETSQGLGLFQENSSDPIAILIETDKGGSYIYNSLTNQGVAYFNEKGNLIVEYFNKQDNKKVTLTYKLLN